MRHRTDQFQAHLTSHRLSISRDPADEALFLGAIDGRNCVQGGSREAVLHALYRRMAFEQYVG